MTKNILNAAVLVTRADRKYVGEFTNHMEFDISPAAEPQVIACWFLNVLEVKSEKGITVDFEIKLASLPPVDGFKSTFSAEYYSNSDYPNRLSLNLVPAVIIDAIEDATGERVRIAYDNALKMVLPSGSHIV